MVQNTTILSMLIIACCFSALINTVVANELPEDFPPFEIFTADNPAPGAMLFSARGQGYGPYLVMADSAGNVIRYKRVNGNTSNFAVHPSGLITFNTIVQPYFKAYSEARIYIADTSLTVLDSIVSSNSLIPAPHTSEMLPNGHIVFSSFEAHHVDMSKVVDNGNPNAIVAGAILVEVDNDKNVVFQWRSWDYIEISDTYQPINDFLNIVTLYSNFNSVAVTPEGDYLICNRLLSEITKVSRETGEIIWRLGGKHNQFTFPNESHEYAPVFFSMQHDIRILPNGNITLFDNGEQYNPPSSRVVEYKIDEKLKIAQKIWEYKPPFKIFAASGASAQRLPNGNTIIGWGNTVNDPIKRDITEVTPNGQITFDMAMPKTVTAFKALKFPYPIGEKKALVMRDELLPLNTYKFDNDDNTTGVSLVFSTIEGFMYNWIWVIRYDWAPQFPIFEGQSPNVAPYRFHIDAYNFDGFDCEVRINISSLSLTQPYRDYSLYVRDSVGKGTFKKLETFYIDQDRELRAKTSKFGEFIIAKDYKYSSPRKPLLLLPKNDAIVPVAYPVTFSWSPQGYFKTAHLIVASDENFENVIHDIDDLKVTSFTIDLDENKSEYYWKVAISNDSEQGEWSEVRKLIVNDFYINLITPKAGEVWNKDTLKKFIRWETNLVGTVNINLLKDDEVITIIKDTIKSHTGAYAWFIPDEIEPGTDYSLEVIRLDGMGSATTKGYFEIKDPTASVVGINANGLHITNHPNPPNGSTIFEFHLPESGNVSITIHDIFGQFYTEILNNFVEEGSYSLNWNTSSLPQGIYIYKLTIGSKSVSGKIVVVL